MIVLEKVRFGCLIFVCCKMSFRFIKMAAHYYYLKYAGESL